MDEYQERLSKLETSLEANLREVRELRRLYSPNQSSPLVQISETRDLSTRIEIPNTDLEEHVRRYGIKLEDFIWLPQEESLKTVYHSKLKQHGILVAMERSRFGMRYKGAETDLHNTGALMIVLPEFTSLGRLLGSDEVYDGNGNPINKGKITGVNNNIFEVRDPWRAEFSGNKFTKTKSGVTTTYFTINKGGKLEKVTEPLDNETLLEDQKIDLNAWLKNPTSQGLPKTNTSNGSTWYWPPRDSAVAVFYANTFRAGLFCYGNPDNSNASLGVREVRAKFFS